MISLQAPAGSVIVAPFSSNSVGFTLAESKFIAINGFTVTGTNVARGFSLSSYPGNSDISIEGNIVFNIGTPTTLGSAGIVIGTGNPRTWTQTNGPTVTLSSSQSAAPTFTAPAAGPGGATLVFQHVVDDGLRASQPDLVTITVLNVNDPPACSVARADQEDLWPPNHKLVPVRITGISDPNNDAVWITVTGVIQRFNESLKLDRSFRGGGNSPPLKISLPRSLPSTVHIRAGIHES